MQVNTSTLLWCVSNIGTCICSITNCLTLYIERLGIRLCGNSLLHKTNDKTSLAQSRYSSLVA